MSFARQHGPLTVRCRAAAVALDRSAHHANDVVQQASDADAGDARERHESLVRRQCARLHVDLVAHDDVVVATVGRLEQQLCIAIVVGDVQPNVGGAKVLARTRNADLFDGVARLSNAGRIAQQYRIAIYALFRSLIIVHNNKGISK